MFNRIIYCIVKALTSQEEILLGNPTGFGNPNVFHRSLSLAIDNKYQFSFEHKCNFKKNACLMNQRKLKCIQLFKLLIYIWPS